MTVEIKVPTMGESVTEATISKWFKKEGDAVKRDEPLLELETDKVTVEVPSPADGAIESISVQAGATVQVGALLGAIAEGKGGSAPAPKAPAKAETPKPAASPAPTPQRLRPLGRAPPPLRKPTRRPCRPPSAFQKNRACLFPLLPAPAGTAASPRVTCWARLRRVRPPLHRLPPRRRAPAPMKRAK